MALLDFEIAMGSLVRARSAALSLSGTLSEAEVSCFEALKASAGLRFTMEVQRSWCVGRAKRAGSLTLSVLSEGERGRLLDEWVDAGGGTSSFFAAESEALLEFIAGRLPNPSHELTVCRLEQATKRANQHARAFRAPGCEILSEAGCALRRGRYAGMVVFYATTVLFAPGLDRLYRVASPREVALWNMLAGTMPVGSLSTEGYRRPELASLLREGILEPTGV